MEKIDLNLQKNKKTIILIGGGQDEKLKEDFLSFFKISNYEIVNLQQNELPVSNRELFPIVLCTYDKEKSYKILKKSGLRYKRDYVLAEDFFKNIDLDISHDCKKLYVHICERDPRHKLGFYSRLFMIIHHICREDMEKRYASFKMVWILSFAFALVIENIFKRKIVFCKDLDRANITKEDIICVGKNQDESDRLLYLEGIAKGRKVYTLERLERYCFVSRLLRRTYLDRRQNKCGCTLPYEMFYINPRGNIWLCPCFGELNVSDLTGNSALEAWNSPIAQVMRLSVENNTYSFCDRRCKEFWNHEDGKELLERKKLSLPQQPSQVFISFDRACNLRCRSCRTEPYFKLPAK